MLHFSNCFIIDCSVHTHTHMHIHSPESTRMRTHARTHTHARAHTHKHISNKQLYSMSQTCHDKCELKTTTSYKNKSERSNLCQYLTHRIKLNYPNVASRSNRERQRNSCRFASPIRIRRKYLKDGRRKQAQRHNFVLVIHTATIDDDRCKMLSIKKNYINFKKLTKKTSSKLYLKTKQ